MLTIWVMAAVLSAEAVHRMFYPEPVDGPLMTVVASAGLVSNLLLMATLGHQHADLNSLLSDDPGSGHVGCACGPPKAAESAVQEVVAAPPPSMPAGTKKAKFCDTFVPADTCAEKPASEDSGSSLAMRAAVIHIIGDIVQSIGAVLAGVLIWWEPFDLGMTAGGFSRWCYVDACITMLFVGLCFLTTRSTIKEVLMNLLMTCPRQVDMNVFQRQLSKISGVVSTHDVHVWQIGQSKVCTAHVVIANPLQSPFVLDACSDMAWKSHKMDHTTFQIEVGLDPSLCCKGHEGES